MATPSNMELPVFAPYPPLEIQQSFPADGWKSCLEAWSILANAYLDADDKTFKQASEQKSFATFLKSFYEQWKQANARKLPEHTVEFDTLVHQCFCLVARCSNSNSQHPLFADLEFLARFARAHVKSKVVRTMLTEIWTSKNSPFQKSMQKWKAKIISELETGSPGLTLPALSSSTPLLYACGEAAAFLMTGSDFLEAIMAAYKKDDKQSRLLVLITYIGLASLIRDNHANATAFTDHVYTLKAQADAADSNGLLSDLVTNTPFMKALKRYTTTSGTDRVKQLAGQLKKYRTPSIARQRKHAAKKRAKGKQHAGSQPLEMHIHRMSLVSQVQDLFPDLGSGFVMRLLDEYKDNVEQVTLHLLDESLPAHLSGLDRHEQADIHDTGRQTLIDQLAPRFTPPLPESFIPQRANIFDGDDFDRLEIDTSKLHIGKKEQQVGDSTTSNKAAVLAALAAFDADDDERDDTYDIEDVGGTVDGSHHDGDDTAIGLRVTDNDLVLYRRYQTEPEAFGRSADTRRSKARATLKTETDMTDEAIEGWAIMLQRDPKRANRMAMEANNHDGTQNVIARTAYRQEHGDTENEDSDAGPSANRGRGGYRGRGRGRGGSVAGPSGDASTAQAQRRKEANKSSRANHNRRNQRAKKMARGGFSGPA